MWPDFGEISSNSFEDITFARFSGSSSAVTLTFDLLIPKYNQHIYEPEYIFDQNIVEYPSLVFEIRCSQGFRYAQTHRQTHSRRDPPENRMRPAPKVFGSGCIQMSESPLQRHVGMRRKWKQNLKRRTEPRCLRTVCTSSADAASSDVRSLPTMKSSRVDGCSSSCDVIGELLDTVCDCRRCMVASNCVYTRHTPSVVKLHPKHG